MTLYHLCEICRVRMSDFIVEIKDQKKGNIMDYVLNAETGKITRQMGEAHETIDLVNVEDVNIPEMEPEMKLVQTEDELGTNDKIVD